MEFLMQQLIIRDAREDDTNKLEILFKITRQKTFKSAPHDSFKFGDYKKSVEGEKVWVVEKDGDIVGFISIWIQDNFIHNLFVHPNYQGCGIGAQLLQKAEEYLSRPMELKVTTENIKAFKFYEKHGWKKISIHEDELEPYILLRKY
jgi:ribosomal protein S18 acetylase RimI-like enzyme